MGLQDAVTKLKGVGPRANALLKNLGIQTISDLIYCFPRRYEDRTQILFVVDCIDGESACVHGTVLSFDESLLKNRLTLTKLIFRDDHDNVGEAVWFRRVAVQAVRSRALGRRVAIYGKVKIDRFRTSLQNPDLTWLPDTDGDISLIPTQGLVPVYALTDGLTQSQLRVWVSNALSQYAPSMVDGLPGVLRAKHGYNHIMTCLKYMHNPTNAEEGEAARQRFAYEELLVLQTFLQMRRLQDSQKQAPPLRQSNIFEDQFVSNLPFVLTPEQMTVLMEIRTDLSTTKPMLRLLQGDVGCGKTVVAAGALLQAVANSKQAVFLAPTEILARQQLSALRSIIEPFGISVEYLSGNVPDGRRRSIIERLSAMETMVLVGTHAILEDSIPIPNLALAVVDEQHRFGVIQRNLLMRKPIKGTCHMLLMSATPIPRTLTQVTLGDMDVSTIESLPIGRRPIKTHVKSHAHREMVYAGLCSLVAKGQQGYVVCPKIGTGAADELASVVSLYNQLSAGWLAGLRIGMVHGQQRDDERLATMDAFRQGLLDVLVATTVIEVGVDVSNAVAIIIESADCFGLAQLHQLRGRVGRGTEQSFCVLVMSENPTDIGQDRLRIMTSTTNGFMIAEEDVRLRGPGDVIGSRQSGLPSLYVTDLTKDVDLILHASTDAMWLLDQYKLPYGSDVALFLDRVCALEFKMEGGARA